MIRILLVGMCLVLTACQDQPSSGAPPQVPRGYYAQLEVVHAGKQLSFGPFVGYYFKPVQYNDLTQLQFICFNERGFYTDQLPAGTLLFTGKAILATLPDNHPKPEPRQRINPVFFADAPQEWLATRPEPKDEYVHFHSAYDSKGATLTGYWLRHHPERDFTYNMGGRVAADSPLFHHASPNQQQNFPRIVEFDFGPDHIETWNTY